jgi:hypothetical protein
MTETPLPTPSHTPDADPDILLALITEATAGDYEIIGELGRGGMAAVFLARDISLNRKVAVKTMLPELTSRRDMVERFKREAQMAAGLSHPHIVQIHSVRETKRLVYFVMKYIEGRGLDSIIAAHGALDLDMTRLVLQQAGSALSFAHHRGVVHRDVKPANIMIDENGWAIVTDFGIAKVDDGAGLTATGMTVGTPQYMSPEQFYDKPVTGASDQYSLGIVAFEMLSGQKPFDGKSVAEIITKHLFSEPPDIRQGRPDLPDVVKEAIDRMLAKEPAARFPELDAAIAALGPPSPAAVEAARGRLMSLARSSDRKVRLSVPLSPVAVTRPSAATAILPTGDRAARAAGPAVPALPASAPPRRSRRGLAVAVGVLALAASAAGAWLWRGRAPTDPERNRNLQRGIASWQAGRRQEAAAAFGVAAREMPQSALPHVYLSRLAREDRNLAQARAEAARAAQLEPANHVALREVGLVLLAAGDNDGARRFFIRAVRANAGDRTSMGWLACSLRRLGQAEQAARWSGRAGEGAWSACLR